MTNSPLPVTAPEAALAARVPVTRVTPAVDPMPTLRSTRSRPLASSFRRRYLSALALAMSTALLAGCNDERAAVAPPRPVAPPIAANAWIVVSDSAARAGSEVTVSAFARSEAGGAVGSFTARFLYDSLQLSVIGPDSIADGALRAVNPIAGEYRIAGASAQGLDGGLLFRVRARVIDPRGLRRLGLVLDEMHSIKFADLTTQLEVKDTRDALLSGVAGLRQQPTAERRP